MCGQISRGTGHNCPPSLIQLAVAQVIDQTADLSVYETNMKLLYDCLVKLDSPVSVPAAPFTYSRRRWKRTPMLSARRRSPMI